MEININLGEHSYPILIEKGCLKKLGNLVNLNRKVLVITDDGVPPQYAQTVCNQCSDGHIATIKSGEESKDLKTFEHLLGILLDNHFTRSDLVVAVGGGVIGDLAGFVSASYMRGIDFINCPTTTLSQIDSSIGGKVAVNFKDTKNTIGAFHQPKYVAIDPTTLDTLPPRHFSAGLAEAIKAGLIFDEKLFCLLETCNIQESIEEILHASLLVKKDFVEKDEKETGIRAALNFGHTIGHGIESYSHQPAWDGDILYHGECVALGMLFFLADVNLRTRLLAIYKKLDLPATISYDGDAIFKIVKHDKKASEDNIKIVKVEKLGNYTLEKVPTQSLRTIIGEGI